MRKHTAAGAAACLGVLAMAGWPATRAAFAAECLTSPQGARPAGYHWYYQTDRATNRKCWYLRKPRAAAETRAAAPARPAVGRSGQPPAQRAKRQREVSRPKRQLDREALFEEFLRWQKQDNQR